MKKIILISFALMFTMFAFGQVDTSGIKTWKPMFNSMLTWEDGSFNMFQKGHPDYGWGVYNSLNHNVIGDSIFVIKLQNGSYKILAIEQKNSMGNIFTIGYADLNGQNKVTKEIRSIDFTTKLFIYYSIQNQTIADRDPVNGDWDMVLSRYVDTKLNYNVTGFLLNEKAKVSVYHAPNATASTNSGLADTTTFDSKITAIGNSWYKLSGFSIIPLDTMVYFVKTPAKDIYKMQVNFFESGGSGKGRVGLLTQKLHPTVEAAVKDTLVMGTGYVNDVYYSMSKRITKTSPRNNWDIAFKTNAFSASILTNNTMGISLYTYPKSDIEPWLVLASPSATVKTANVFPNPVSSFVSFYNSEWTNNSETQLQIFNMVGQMVLNRNYVLAGSNLQTDLSELQNGLYNARILNNGVYYNAKILVSK